MTLIVNGFVRHLFSKPKPRKPLLLLLGLCLWLSFCNIPSQAEKLVLDWQTASRHTLENALQLKIAKLTTAIEGTKIDEAFSEYYPQIQGQVAVEYLRDLSDSERQGVNVVGDSLIVNNTQFQNSAGLTGSMTLFDFGQRRKNIEIKRLTQEQAYLGEKIEEKELLLKLADSYSSLWEALEKIKIKKTICEINEVLYEGQKRLYQAGEIRKPELATASLSWVEAQQQLKKEQQLANQRLLSFNMMTKQDYNLEALELVSLQISQIDPSFSYDPELSPEWRQLEAKLKEKDKELDLLRKQRWAPTISGNVSYYLFGSDSNSLYSGLRDTEPSAARFSLSMRMPLFDGFKNKAQQKRVVLEIERYRVQQQFQEEQLIQQWKEASQLKEDTEGILPVLLEGEQNTSSLVSMNERLIAEQWIPKRELLIAQQKKAEHALIKLEQLARQALANKKLELLRQYGGTP